MNFKFRNLIKLVAENPDLDVLPVVANRCMVDDFYEWWISRWGECRIDECYDSGVAVFFKSKDYNTLIEKCLSELNEKDFESKEAMREHATQIVNNYNWNKYIIIEIEPITE